jgi:hypothetical protein
MHAAAAVSILLSAGIGVAGAASPGAVGPVGVAAAQAQTSVSAAEGPGGPILVVTAPDDPFGDYYAEILRAEGLNEFALSKATALTAETLARHQVVVLAANDALTSAQADLLTQWVRDGGKLIAMRPSTKLASLLGLGSDSGELENGYLKIDTGTVVGAGLTGTTMQFHGAADRWSLAGASSLATLYSNASDATAAPAVTVRSVGSAGGQAAAFAYDLARSVVYTRQGNPDWAGQKRDASTVSIRPADLFYGAKADDAQPDWVQPGKVAIPQADEQQRLLSNLIVQMNLGRTPLPRFWYLPRGEKAAVVMTGDDHGNGGTSGQFDRFKAASPAGCSVAGWECVRSTSYLYPYSPLSDAQARAYEAEGFEIALHLSTNCQDFTPASLEAAWQWDLPRFAASWSVAPLRTNRTHCVTWSDWASEPKAELTHGVRFDTNYYYAPGGWVQDRPGMFTGSGFPMRFADLDGSLIDVYQATTQLTDESGMTVASDYRRHIGALLDGALGPNGYYGVFTANMHTDARDHVGANTIVAEAQARGVPVVSAVQMLDWLDGRNGSSFKGLRFEAGQLRFTIETAPGARGLQAMVPSRSARGRLLGLTRDGTPVSTFSRSVKGINYEVFDAPAGEYVATYPHTPPPSGAVGGSPATDTPAAPATSNSGATRRVVRVSRRGVVKLAVRCPWSKRRCRITVRLKAARKTITRKTVMVKGPKTVKARLRLPKETRLKLVRRGTLSMTAVIRVRAAGAKLTTRVPLELRAPSG